MLSFTRKNSEFSSSDLAISPNSSPSKRSPSREALKVALLSQKKVIAERSSPKSRPLIRHMFAGKLLDNSMQQQEIAQAVMDYTVNVHQFGIQVADALMNSTSAVPSEPPPPPRPTEWDFEDFGRLHKRQRIETEELEELDVDLEVLDDVDELDDGDEFEPEWLWSDELEAAITELEQSPISSSPPLNIPCHEKSPTKPATCSPLQRFAI